MVVFNYVLFVFCCRELLERYSQCKTSVEVIAVQDQWLQAETKAVKDDSIDYPPSCSSSSDEDSEVEEGETNSSSKLSENDPSSSSSVYMYVRNVNYSSW